MSFPVRFAYVDIPLSSEERLPVLEERRLVRAHLEGTLRREAGWAVERDMTMVTSRVCLRRPPFAGTKEPNDRQNWHFWYAGFCKKGDRSTDLCKDAMAGACSRPARNASSTPAAPLSAILLQTLPVRQQRDYNITELFATTKL